MLGLLGLSTASRAVTILSGPSFTQATNAPLAGVLHVTTDVPTRLTVSVDEGTNVWTRRFYDYATAHAQTLVGFRPGRTNRVSVTVYDRYRQQTTAPAPVVFVTAPLPTNFPTLTLRQSEPAKMEPGYTLFDVQIHSGTYWFVAILDSSGQVVWYNTAPSTADVRLLPNGDLFMPTHTNFLEMNLLGETINSWLVPTNLLINPHDGVPTGHGTILYLSDAFEVLPNYPTSMTVSNALRRTADVGYQRVVEISTTNAAVLNTWSPITVLDPYRISYLITDLGNIWDTEHCNAVIEDPSDDSLIVSMRHQNAVIKISRATGQLRWILGPPENWGPQWQPYLLRPVGTPFVWQYGQHAPVFTPQRTLMMFDDGNFRASTFAPSVQDSNNYSRAVEYSINEQTMEVSQVWDYGRTNMAERLYVGFEGNAEPEPRTGNVLIDFAAVSYVNGVPPSSYGPSVPVVRLVEVTHDAVPQVVFDLEISIYANTNVTYKNCSVYRAHRIADLYPHPPQPVADLSVGFQGMPRLDFSADDTRTYIVQASTNLADWTTIGTAAESAQQDGNFSYQDTRSAGASGAYYRVITQ
jgi:arylsulfate sulfotransferase